MKKTKIINFFCYFIVCLLLVGCCEKEYAYPTGKDDILVFGDGRIAISKFASDKWLILNRTDGAIDCLLQRVQSYKLLKGALYVKSEEGYGIVDKDYSIRLFITIPAEEFVSGYSEDKEGNRTYHSRFVENDHILYLNSFSDFSKKEQEILTQLKIK